MRILKNLNMDIPGGWYWDCKETNFRVEPPKDQNTFRGLIKNVVEHLVVNNLDIPADIDKLIQHQISLRLPQELSKEITADG